MWRANFTRSNPKSAVPEPFGAQHKQQPKFSKRRVTKMANYRGTIVPTLVRKSGSAEVYQVRCCPCSTEQELPANSERFYCRNAARMCRSSGSIRQIWKRLRRLIKRISLIASSRILTGSVPTSACREETTLGTPAALAVAELALTQGSGSPASELFLHAD